MTPGKPAPPLEVPVPPREPGPLHPEDPAPREDLPSPNLPADTEGTLPGTAPDTVGSGRRRILDRSAFWLVCAGFVIYSIVWSYLAELRLFGLRASVYDLGISAEEGWQLHATSYSTTALVYELFRFGGNLVLWPVTLGGLGFMLAFQSTMLGLGGVLVYLIARAYRLGPWTSLGLAGVYFLYFPLAGVNFNDYHIEAFLLPLFLAGYLLFLHGHFRSSFLLVLLCGLLWYPMGLYPALFGLLIGGGALAAWLADRQPWTPSSPPPRRLWVRAARPLVRWVAAWKPAPSPRTIPWWFPAGLLLGGTVLVAGGAIVTPSTPLLGSALATAHALSLSPGANLPLKGFTLLLLLAPLAFLPLLAPRWLVFDLPFFTLVMAADYYGYVFPGIATDWHVFLVIPFLFLGAIEGLSRIRGWGEGRPSPGRPSPSLDHRPGTTVVPSPTPTLPWRGRIHRRNVRPQAAGVAVTCAIGVTLVCGAFLTPYGPFNSGTPASFQSSELLHYNATLYQDLMTLIHLIPASNPSVVFQDNMPELLPRPFMPDAVGPLVPGPFDGVAYNLTYPTPFGGWKTFLPDYVIGDPVPLPDTFFSTSGTPPFNISLQQILGELYASGQYGTLGEAQGMWVIARHYTGPLRFYAPFQQTFLPSAFLASLGEQHPPGCASPCLRFTNLSQGQTAWYGPYTYLAPGSYRATFNIPLQGWNASSSVTLDITHHSGKFVLGSEIVRELQGTPGPEPLRLSIPFNVTDGFATVEFRAVDSYFNGELTLSSVDVQEVAPP